MRDHENEDVLAGIERLVFVSEQAPAAAQHHRAVTAAQRLDVQRIFHAADITLEASESVTLVLFAGILRRFRMIG